MDELDKNQNAMKYLGKLNVPFGTVFRAECRIAREVDDALSTKVQIAVDGLRRNGLIENRVRNPVQQTVRRTIVQTRIITSFLSV